MKTNVKADRDLAFMIILCLLILFGLWECLLGWGQLMGITVSGHSLYPATGTFYNPGPYCGFLAILMPPALSLISNKRDNVSYWISISYLTMSIALLPVLMGRTGWLAAITGCIYVLTAYRRIPRPSKKSAVYITTVSLALILLIIYIKPYSALGRLLIWRNGLAAMGRNPVSGVGWDNVAGELGSAQEDYFASYPDSIFTTVAGSPEYAFNEFLQIGIAFGLFSLTAFIVIIGLASYCAHKSDKHGIVGSLIAFTIVCLSSYPLQFPEFTATLSILIILSIIPIRKLNTVLVILSAGIVMLCSGAVISNMTDRHRQNDRWDRIRYTYQYRLTDSDEIYLDSLMNELKWNPRFLFDYGKALRQNGKYDKSNRVLEQGEKISSDPMFLNLIGRNHQDMGNPVMAGHYFRRSVNRLPGRLYPYYLLARLYADPASFDHARFREIYDITISMKPKIGSPAITRMKQELQHLNDSINNTVQTSRPEISASCIP